MTKALDNPVWYALTGSRRKPCLSGERPTELDPDAHRLRYAASLCLCIGLQLASSLIILCAPRVVREPVSATERG